MKRGVFSLLIVAALAMSACNKQTTENVFRQILQRTSMRFRRMNDNWQRSTPKHSLVKNSQYNRRMVLWVMNVVAGSNAVLQTAMRMGWSHAKDLFLSLKVVSKKPLATVDIVQSWLVAATKIPSQTEINGSLV